MNCRRAKPLLPLAAGGDLPRRKADRLEAHLARCPACRTELRSFRSSLEELRGMARGEARPEWSEPEWRAVVQRFLAHAGRHKRTSPTFLGRPAWMWRVSVVLLLAAAVLWLVFLPRPPSPPAPPPRPTEKTIAPDVRPAAVRPEPVIPVKSQRETARVEAPPRPAHKTRHLVFVSSESGLTIHWVLNSDFEWKENVR